MIKRLKNSLHLLEALFANIIYGFPARKLFVIGVTGTDGKTTTVSLIYHILKESGKKVAMISTVGAAIGNKTYDIGFHVTTPSSFALQKYIKKAVDEKSEYLVLEVTSHGLDQNRVFGIKFDIGVLTNVSHEHLDYHKTYEKYVATKFKLLETAKVAVVNRDDDSYRVISNFKFLISNQFSNSDNSQKIITYGMKNNTDVNPDKFPFRTNLIGEFNRYNCLAAIAVCQEIGLSDEEIREAILSFKTPIGRGEMVFDKDFKVMIDFAHTPNAFEQILPEVRKMTDPPSPLRLGSGLRRTKGRLIHVFGCAGERDASKRPLMGEVASRFDDVIILTAEDPRSESVEKIMEEIGKGIFNFNESPHPNPLPRGEREWERVKIRKGKKYLFKISNRKEAIGFAVGLAEKGDLVFLTGKAHEKSMNYGRGEELWDEFKVVDQAISKRFET